MKNYIFISYAHKDSERVLPVVQKLQESGYNVWYDDGIDPGTEWAVNIADHIEGCSYFLAFMSNAYLDSDNCKEEWNFARDEKKNRFLVYIEDVKLPNDMRMRSSMIQNIFMHRYSDLEAFYSKLFAAPGIEVCKVIECEGIQNEVILEEDTSDKTEAQEVVQEAADAKISEVVDSEAVEVAEVKVEEAEEEEAHEKQADEVKAFRGILYSDDGTSVTIVSYKENVKQLSIPEEIKGMPVVKIGARAFASCESLNFIRIPECVLEIEQAAFRGCCNLTSVEVMNKACVIAEDSFEGCIQLKKNPLQKYFEIEESEDRVTIRKCIIDAEEIIIPDKINGKSVRAIGNNAFRDCTSLTNVVIPKGVTKIEALMFYGCKSLLNVEIPDSVTEIEPRAFRDCTRLSSIVIPKGVTSIEASAFYGCERLSSIVLPEKVAISDRHVFEGCLALPIDSLDERTCEKLAMGGHVDARAKMLDIYMKRAHKYSEGDGVEKDAAKAIIWYAKAADLGNADAEYIMAMAYEEGKILGQDVDKALRLYCGAARSGRTAAQCRLLYMYLKGQDVDVYNESLYDMYLNVINQDDSLKEMIDYIRVLKEDRTLVRSDSLRMWNQKAAESGNAYAQYETGRYYEEQDEIPHAMRLYEMAAKQDYKDAQKRLAYLYEKLGEIRAAVKWYEKASVSDEQCVHLTELYLKLNDYVNVVKYIKRAGDSKDTEVVFQAALICMLANNYGMANGWFRKAAERGHKAASCMLGVLYGTGRGIEKNDEEAKHWYEKASEQDVASCIKWFEQTAD